MEVVGRFMESAPYVRCLIFDGHGSHQFIRRCLHGDFRDGRIKLVPEDLQELPFWKELTHEPLPRHAPDADLQAQWRGHMGASWPVCHGHGTERCVTFALSSRLASRQVAMFQRTVICKGHASKNAGGQLNSCIRTIYMGDYWTDSTAAYLQGLPPCAYVRADPMSDRLNALLMCPWFLVRKAETWMS